LFEAGVPHLINPFTLETIGEDSLNLGNELKSGMSVLVPALRELNTGLHDTLFGASATAHPKIDRSKNVMITWTWRARVNSNPLDTNPQIYIHEFDSNMKKEFPTTTHILHSTTVAPHDFSFTENHYVFIENRVKGNTLPYILGTKCPAECVDIIPSEKMILNIVKRPSDISADKNTEVKGKYQCIPLTPGFTIHSVCSWEENNILTLITTAWDTETVSSGKVKGGLLGAWEGLAPLFDDIPVTLLYETIVDLNNNQLISHKPVKGLEKVIVEHPHINPSYEGKKIRFLYMSIGSIEGISSPPQGYLKLDLQTGASQIWYAKRHTYCEEVVVIPKSDGNNEDDVYFLATMFDSTINKSSIGIFDGNDISNGPIAVIPLTHHLPHSLHGCFASSIVS
jgi:carotenoid cleavage dioxygenase-like enzyme